jgi:hypothetical protein
MKIFKHSNKNILSLSYSIDNKYAEWKVRPEVMQAQKKVFNHFGLTLNQISDSLQHGHWMTKICKEIAKHNNIDIVVFFDLDCIPLKENIYDHILSKIDENTICGIEQSCDCNKSAGHIYAGPACLAFHVDILKKIDDFSFVEDDWSDVAQRFTYDCQEKNINVNFFKFISSQSKLWRLGDTDEFFGIGSVYDDIIYHHFNIRMPEHQQSFISKCNEVINSSEH